MGLLDRFRATPRPAATVSAHLHPGDEDLEVVGESYHQEALWTICGGVVGGDRVRYDITAVLVPEPDNPYDANAIAVHVDGQMVGYLARDEAVRYGPGLRSLMAACGGYVALAGVIVGGGQRENGLGLLGVWLEHDPAAFGLPSTGSFRRVGPASRPVSASGSMRTGFSEAWLTDVDDDSYDLSWFDDLPDADRPAIALLRGLLASDPDPIDRHFQFAELESRLYRCRDLYETALDEYDAICRQHDAEMATICGAFLAKWGKVPLLETYRQMAIRRQKQKDWTSCLWWAERGLSLYGSAAAREEAVEDLLKRRNRARAKLETTSPAARPRQPTTLTAALAPPAATHRPAGPAVPGTEIEVLTCGRCDTRFERLRVRGRKPGLCPDCRSTPGT
jgi:hypothetical protein